jgi:multidrug resistance efflux pump
MLNISGDSIKGNIKDSQYRSLKLIQHKTSSRILIRVVLIMAAVVMLTLFLPWTQNIRTGGVVTTIKPDQRPQTIHSIIAGRIEKWYVQEGDFVQRGDTILYISEIKEEYIDPNLIERTQQQLMAKELAVESYEGKVEALESQIKALENAQILKTQQARNKLIQANLKVESDSIDYEAAKINFDIAKEQFARIEELYQEGLNSLVDYERRKLNLQKAQAEMISKQNKLLTSSNEVINAEVELDAIQADFQDKIAKARSEMFTAKSNQFDAEATVAKLRNSLSNYELRNQFYYITAPQSGFVTQAIQTGIGETIKAGDSIVSIMPGDFELAVEMYVRPIDLPLLKKGQKVRIQFDGWPAIIFSGWPNTSYGTYGGEVFAIDNFISPNGKYRILVSKDPDDVDWPDALRVGSGTINMVLLNDVPIWYEMWRQVNGFPPNYYTSAEMNGQSEKK